MPLSCAEFIRHFEQHILPKRFTRIRTYGYLANRNRQQRINKVHKKLKLPVHKERVNVPIQVRMIEPYGIDINQCPCSKNKTMQLVQDIIHGYMQMTDVKKPAHNKILPNERQR